MEKAKTDYIAVPTSEPLLYEEQEKEEQVEVQQPKKGHRLKFFLIGGAIALIGLGHLCNHKDYEFTELHEKPLDLNLFEYPNEVANAEIANDLNEFMRHLDSSFGHRPCGMNFNRGPHEPHGHPHGPPPHERHVPPHEPEEENLNFSNKPLKFDGERKLKSHRKFSGFRNHDQNDKFKEVDGERKLDSHRKFNGFSNHDQNDKLEEVDGERKLDSHHRYHGHHNKETQEFDGVRKLDSHHKHHGFPKHHNEGEAQNFDTPPPHGNELVLDKGEMARPFGPPSHLENICKVENLNATSTVFSFSPEKFQKTFVFLDGFFSHGGKVFLSKSSDKSIQDVRVNVTLFHGNENLTKQVALSAFDHKGKYHVEIKRDHHGHGRFGPAPPHNHHHRRNETIEDCLVYAVNIEFPESLDYFEGIGLHIKGAHRIGGDLDNIEFGSIKAGLGYGVINFENLKAKTVKLGVLGGFVVGNYHVAESISAGSIHGGIELNVFPTSENINVTTSSISGPSTLNIPSENYAGKFFVSSLFGDPTIQAYEPENVHVTKLRPTYKSGYFKEDKNESKIFVSTKKGSATLKFN